MALGGALVLPAAAALLPQLSRDPDWRRRHAALMTLSQVRAGGPSYEGPSTRALLSPKGLRAQVRGPSY